VPHEWRPKGCGWDRARNARLAGRDFQGDFFIGRLTLGCFLKPLRDMSGTCPCFGRQLFRGQVNTSGHPIPIRRYGFLLKSKAKNVCSLAKWGETFLVGTPF
jgi:hypothetical protein